MSLEVIFLWWTNEELRQFGAIWFLKVGNLDFIHAKVPKSAGNSYPEITTLRHSIQTNLAKLSLVIQAIPDEIF